MMAGHTLLHILGMFALKIPNLKLIGFLKSLLFLLPLLIIFLVFVLEFAIAFIQAYVFFVLLCIYLNDTYHPSH